MWRSMAPLPTAKSISQPVTYAFYDGHVDWMLSTDVSNKADAASSHINYSTELITQSVSKSPSLYIVSGPAAADQPLVFGSEPGEDDYSPLWREIGVKWEPGVTPVSPPWCCTRTTRSTRSRPRESSPLRPRPSCSTVRS
jgi:hypothetical protein